MTPALLCASLPATLSNLLADVSAADITPLGTVDECCNLVQAVIGHAPEVVICDVPNPGAGWLDAFEEISRNHPCPILLFTQDDNVGLIARAIECGVHVYVVQGYGAHRIRSLVNLARARYVKAEEQRRALEDIAMRYAERKAVDRAKGILMRTQSLSDDDAFRTLRSAAMNSNQRMGQLSQHIIQSAMAAECVNRAGQLRMLSQRMIKLHLLQSAAVSGVDHGALVASSVVLVDSNLEFLRRIIKDALHVELLERVTTPWVNLKAAVEKADIAALEDSAEALLLGAERLTSALESAGTGAPLQVLNLAGRQRMLSQRFAKFALLASLEGTESELARKSVEGMCHVQHEFEAALTYLNSIPLSTPDIYADLGAAGVAWLRMVDAARECQRKPFARRASHRTSLAECSETLLDLFERLSVHYEHSMQMLVG